MIGLIAALVMQDAPTLRHEIESLRGWCSESWSSAPVTVRVRTAEGLELVKTNASDCGFVVDGFVGDSGEVALLARDVLAPPAGDWYVAEWRRPAAGPGSDLKSDFENRLAGVVQMSEPSEGQRGRLSIQILPGD